MVLSQQQIQELKRSLEPYVTKKGDERWLKAKEKGLDVEGGLSVDNENRWLESQGALKFKNDTYYVTNIPLFERLNKELAAYRDTMRYKKIGSLGT